MRKNLHLESLRGIAIILVLSLHLSVEPEFNSIKNTLDAGSYMFSNIRMPLFTVISGFFFTYLGTKNIYSRIFIKKKFIRIIVPLYAAILLELSALYTISVLTDGKFDQSVFRAIFFSYGHYWFLQAIFLIFTTYFILNKIFKDQTKLNIYLFCITTLLYLLLPLIGITSSLFSIDGAVYLYPYFILGSSFLYLKSSPNHNTYKMLSVAALLVLMYLQAAAYETELMYLFKKRTLCGFLIGIAACYLLLSLEFKSKILAYIGGYSFVIYLYQAFGSKISKLIIFNALELDGYVAFLLLVAGTIVFGVIFDHQLRRTKITKLVFLGRDK